MRRILMIGILGALASSACEGEPAGHKFEIGPDGKIVPDSIEPIFASEAVAVRTQALETIAHVGYVVDCGSARFPIASGEGILFDDVATLGQCSAVGWDQSRQVELDLFAPIAHWKNGVSFNDRVRSSVFRAPPDSPMCVVYDQHCADCAQGTRQKVLIQPARTHQFTGPNSPTANRTMLDASGLSMFANPVSANVVCNGR
jgi:hypothetical protein